MAVNRLSDLIPPTRRLDIRFAEMWAEREQWVPRWTEIANLMCPTRPLFLADNYDKAKRSNSMIVDGTAIRAAEIMVSGLIAATVNPGSLWFELAPSHKHLEASRAARSWYRSARDVILDVYERSNFYSVYGQALHDQIRFGTGAYLQFEHPSKHVRFEALPVGGYAIAQDSEGNVNSLCREMSLTAMQIYEMFGEDMAGDEVIEQIEQRRLSARFVVRHLIEPNPMPLEKSPYARDLPYRETYWLHRESVGNTRENPGIGAWNGGAEPHVLKRGGYHEFPAVVLRWQRNPEDTWGTSCPGLLSKGDQRELQSHVRKRSKAQGKTLNPPFNVPVSKQGQPWSLVEGAKNYVDSVADGEVARPSFEFRYDIPGATAMIDELRNRVEAYFSVNVFLALLSDDRTQPPTAEEVRGRQQEKAALIGPIAEKNADDGHTPTISRTMSVLIRQSMTDWLLGRDGVLPLPPEEIRGRESRVVYVSEIDRIRKLGALDPLDRHVTAITALAQFDPAILDTLDFDAVARISADANAVPPEIARTPEEVGSIRQQRAEQQLAQQAAERSALEASAAKDLSKAQLGQNSALDAVLGG